MGKDYLKGGSIKAINAIRKVKGLPPLVEGDEPRIGMNEMQLKAYELQIAQRKEAKEKEAKLEAETV